MTRRSLVLDALPCQPQLGLVQASCSFPNIFIASASESDALHLRCKFMLWCPLGHSKIIRYAKLIVELLYHNRPPSPFCWPPLSSSRHGFMMPKLAIRNSFVLCYVLVGIDSNFRVGVTLRSSRQASDETSSPRCGPQKKRNQAFLPDLGDEWRRRQ